MIYYLWIVWEENVSLEEEDDEFGDMRVVSFSYIVLSILWAKLSSHFGGTRNEGKFLKGKKNDYDVNRSCLKNKENGCGMNIRWKWKWHGF